MLRFWTLMSLFLIALQFGEVAEICEGRIEHPAQPDAFAPALLAHQSKTLKGGKAFQCKARFTQGAPHEDIAPAFRQAVSQKSVQALKLPPAGRVQSRLRRIEKRGHRQGLVNHLTRPFELSEPALESQAPDGRRRLDGIKRKGDG